MTDVQLYLAIGIPTLAVLLGILTNSMQISAMNTQMSAMNTRISAFEARVDGRFNALENRIDGRFNNLEVKFDTLTGKVIELDNRVTRIEAKLNIS